MSDFDEQTPLPFRSPGRRMKRGIYVFPSLLTAAALFSGFYSIIFTLNALAQGRENFRLAMVAILVAGFFDSLDGRVARLMRAETEFGSHFDSIADMVSFGVAPAVLSYAWALMHLGRLGWLGSFLFLACAAIRLARFNVLSQQSPHSKKYFKGLPSPVAAGGLAVCIWMLSDEVPSDIFHWGVFAMTMLLAILMVSNVRFRSYKDVDFRRYPTQTFLVAILILVLSFTFRENALFGFFLIYLASGLVEEGILFRRRRKSDPSVPFLPFGDREN